CFFPGIRYLDGRPGEGVIGLGGRIPLPLRPVKERGSGRHEFNREYRPTASHGGTTGNVERRHQPDDRQQSRYPVKPARTFVVVLANPSVLPSAPAFASFRC